MIVTLDGPAGVGKTTLAKRIAQALDIAYLDSGAMFRALALYLGEGSWLRPEAELADRLKAFAFSLHGAGPDSWLLCNGQVIPDDIRTERIGGWASNIATIACVRTRLKESQQAIGSTTSLVAEGRDMGTVVFPTASRKFFLDATPEARARRRFLQLQALNRPEPLEDIADQIRRRDDQDRNRAIAPLRPAGDAIIVDTSDLDLEGVLNALLISLK